MMLKKYKNKRPARILVADGERTVAQTLSRFLVEQGFAVSTAISGEEAIAQASWFFPDLLLTDVFMGEVSGVKAAAEITAKLPGCKVLFLSGSASVSEVMSAAPERLVYSFMSKPMRPLDLLNAIAYMLPVCTAHDPAPRPVDRDSRQSSAAGMRLAETAFILSAVGA
ncbi:MAG: response regulator [Terracidiphilus sp.]|jgi:two-component system response regulator YesN